MLDQNLFELFIKQYNKNSDLDFKLLKYEANLDKKQYQLFEPPTC